MDIKDEVIRLLCNYKFEDVPIKDTLAEIMELIKKPAIAKDKNGKDIYEGDRVSFEDIGEEGYEYREGYDFLNEAIVVWDDEFLCYMLTDFAEDDNSYVANCPDDGENRLTKDWFLCCTKIEPKKEKENE